MEKKTWIFPLLRKNSMKNGMIYDVFGAFFEKSFAFMYQNIRPALPVLHTFTVQVENILFYLKKA